MLAWPLAVLLAASAGVATQTGPKLDAALAQSIVQGCVREAAAKQHNQAIAVVDPGGHLVAALRMDHQGFGAMDFALAKAEAVAAWGFATSGMVDAADETPGFARAPHVVTVAGGVPIFSADGGTRIGGVGVSGGNPKDDEACAIAGIMAAGLRTSHS